MSILTYIKKCMSEDFKYTIIILAKNENILLCQKIHEITSQNIKEFLIIVANYGSVNHFFQY